MEKLMEKEILLVEDEMIIGMATKIKLEKYGYDIILAGSGNDAINNINIRCNIALILMDIDLGKGPNGIEIAKIILNKKNVPIVFVSSHTEPEIVSLTENITSYGYIVKSSNITAYDASIKMAYKLFREKRKVEVFDLYLKFAINYETEPVFISDNIGNVVFCNKAYLNLIGADNHYDAREFSEYMSYVKVFSNTGDLLRQDDWANTRGLKGLSAVNEIFYVYNSKVNQIQVNYYTYEPIYDENKTIIGTYVKIGKSINDPEKSIINKIKASF